MAMFDMLHLPSWLSFLRFQRLLSSVSLFAVPINFRTSQHHSWLAALKNLFTLIMDLFFVVVVSFLVPISMCPCLSFHMLILLCAVGDLSFVQA